MLIKSLDLTNFLAAPARNPTQTSVLYDTHLLKIINSSILSLG